MPQWRKLHTKATESLDINDMPDDFTRLLWVMLPLKLCREGRGLDSPAWVRSNVFPLREDVSLDMVADAMNWYEQRGMIVRYEVNGREYFYLPSWERHQGNTSKEAESIYPDPPNCSGPTPELVQSNSSTDADADADADEMQMQKDTHGENGDGYQAIRDAWSAHFPDKPQPRKDNSTLRSKVRTRMKSAHFRENYPKALQRAARSTFLHESGFFDLYWFLQNDDNWQKCLNGKYDDRQDTRGSPVANPNSGPYAELEPWT